MSGKRKGSCKARIGLGVALVLLSLVLAVANPAAHAYSAPAANLSNQPRAAGDWTPEDAARASPEMLDLAGWEFYLHRDLVELSTDGLCPPVETLPASAHCVTEARPATSAVASPAGVPYEAQAPPV